MAQDLEMLVVQLSADLKKYENAMNRAHGITTKRMNEMQKKAISSSSAIKAAFEGIGAFLVTGATLNAAKALIDTAARIQNALKTAGLAGNDLKDVYQQLYQSAQKNAAPLESLVTLYGRLSLVQKELGVNQQALLTFTDNVATALRVGGTSAEQASGALLQLSQALGSGVVHAEEFNSILEGAPTIARAAAAGLKEAGGSMATLRQLVIDGKVSSQAFFAAFEAGAPILGEQLDGSVYTLAQRMQMLQTEMVDAAGKIDNVTGASNTLGTALEDLQTVIRATGEVFVNVADTQIGTFLGKVTEGVSKVRELVKFMGGIPGVLDKLGSFQSDVILDKPLGSTLADDAAAKEAERIQNRINDTHDPRTSRLPGMDKPATNPYAPLLPVTLVDYPVKPTGSGGGGTKKSGGGSKQSDYEREIQQIKERTAAIQAETAAQATVNPLIDDYGFAAERASAAQELLTAAQNSGLAVGKELTDVQKLLAGDFEGLSPKAREQAQAILQLATAQAQATAQAEQLQESQRKIRERMDDFKSTSKDVLSGFISDIRNGTSATDALTNALDKVLDKLIEMSLNSIFDGGGGSLLSSLFGGIGGGAFPAAPAPIGVGLFDKGGYTGPGGKYEPAGIVHKGEYVFDAEATRKIGVRNLARLSSLTGYAKGGLVGRASAPAGGTLAGEGSGIKVNIINNSGAQVTQKSRQTSQGPQLDVMIDEMVAAKMSTPGSRSRNAVQAQFGTKNGLAKR